MPRSRERLWFPDVPPLAFALLALSCGGGSGSGPARGPEATGNGPPTLSGYDAQGHAATCETPRDDCPASNTNPDFADQCRLAGYRLMRCGCDDVCSGKLKQSSEFYDASGSAKSCAPEQAGCTPPETSAKFQDACNDARHKLVICGCEWLCNGPLGPQKTSAPRVTTTPSPGGTRPLPGRTAQALPGRMAATASRATPW